MKRYLIVLLLLAGCGKSKPTPTSKPPHANVDHHTQFDINDEPIADAQSHEAQVYAELWRICKAHGYSYHVTCKKNASPACSAKAELHIALPSEGEGGFLVGGEFNAVASGPTEAAELLIWQMKQSMEPPLPPQPEYTFDTGEVKPK